MNKHERNRLIYSMLAEQELIATSSDIELETNQKSQMTNFELAVPNILSPELNAIQLQEIKDLPSLDETVFAQWKIADLPVMFLAGLLGTFTSSMLRDFFGECHDAWGKLPASKGGHGGEVIDQVPGSPVAGGFGHRFKFGHDLLNPFEIDWNQYLEMAKQSGTILPVWLKAYFYWLSHLLQDTFSKEGLPIPGHSLLRKFIDPVKNRKLLEILNTIKMRDITGTALTNAIMGAYLWGTEKSISRVIVKPNYRAFSLMLGANMVTLLSGLLIPEKTASLNWSTIPIIGYYGFNLIKLEKSIRNKLNERDSVLEHNQIILNSNEFHLENLINIDDKNYQELLSFENEFHKYHDRIMVFHNSLKEEILMEA